MLLECIENVLCGGKQRLVFIGNAANLMKKVGEVGLLGESGELRGIIQPYVEQALDAVSLQCAEELAGSLFGKTDAVDLHLSSSSSAKSSP